MGLLSLPTMLRAGYSPQLATGVIAASGTLGQIIPPSIVIVLLGTMAGDLYAAGQEIRAQAAGCSDALTYLGKAAVVSVGTLFQAAMLPGLLLAFLYGAYAFGYAMLNPSRAPAVVGAAGSGQIITKREATTWFLFVPVGIIAGLMLLAQVGMIGDQEYTVDSYTDVGQAASLRTNVSEQCAASMIELHGQAAWDAAKAEQAAIDGAGGVAKSVALTPEEIQKATLEKIASRSPIGTGVAILFMLLALVLTTARGVAPMSDHRPIWIGLGGGVLGLLADAVLIAPTTTPGNTVLILALPLIVSLYGCWKAAPMLAQNDLLKVVFPPLVLVVAVLGSILGGITNPTPAAALGAGGAILLAAYRKLKDQNKSGRIILMTSFSIAIMLLVGTNFDLRIGVGVTVLEQVVAFWITLAAYTFTMFGIFYGCWVLWRSAVLTSVVRETAKITVMVFGILIGSQILNLVLISFGGEHYIQSFLRSFDNELTAFLIVMLVLFFLGFVLDFLEIIYIVVPIVGPVIYGGTFDPSWVTIMITVNLQTSFLTPPFGFALFYLRGVAPPEVTTRHIYAGIVPFVLIQVGTLVLLYFAPWIVTIIPTLLS